MSAHEGVKAAAEMASALARAEARCAALEHKAMQEREAAVAEAVANEAEAARALLDVHMQLRAAREGQAAAQAASQATVAALEEAKRAEQEVSWSFTICWREL